MAMSAAPGLHLELRQRRPVFAVHEDVRQRRSTRGQCSEEAAQQELSQQVVLARGTPRDVGTFSAIHGGVIPGMAHDLPDVLFSTIADEVAPLAALAGDELPAARSQAAS